MQRLVVERVDVPTADGALLASDVYRIDDGARRPCLLQRVPYGRTVPAIANGVLDLRRAVAAGFVVVVQDCRGRGDSTGDFVPFVDEERDAVTTFDWIIGQGWSDGTIGMFGRSYAGLNQWLAARSSHPALRAIAPTISGDDPRAWMWSDGVFEWGFAVWWAVRYLAPGIAALAGVEAWRDEVAALGADPQRLLWGSGVEEAAHLDDVVPFLAEWLAGGPAAGPRVAAASTVPAFVTAGWFDIFAGTTLETFARLAPHRGSQLVVGPWAHGGTFAGVFPDWDAGPVAGDAAVDLAGRQLRWLAAHVGTAAHVAGTNPGPGHVGDGRAARAESLEPGTPDPDPDPVHAFVCGANRWIDLPAWPPAASTELRLAVRRDELGDLVLRAAGGGAAGDRVSVPLNVDDPFPTRGGQTFLPGMEVAALAGPRAQGSLLERPDVVIVRGDAADAPLVVLGEVTVEVVATTDADVERDGLLCVRLCDASPAGEVVAIAEGAANVPRRAGAHQLVVRLGPVGWSFEPGHRPVVLVTRASAPRYRPPAADGPQHVWIGTDGSTVVHLPLLGGDAAGAEAALPD